MIFYDILFGLHDIMEVQEEVEQVANDGGEDGDPEWPICCFSYFVLFCVGLSGSRFLVKCFLQLELKPSQFLYIKLLAVLPSLIPQLAGYSSSLDF